MTWEELEAADPWELLVMSSGFAKRFPAVESGASLTIGMAAHGNLQTTLFALRALLASVRGDFELILVDDASPDDTGKVFELVSRVHLNTKVFRVSRNIEYSGSLNTILSHSQGDNVLFLSNDIFITPAYVSQLLSVAQHNPRVGVIRGCSNFVDNGLIPHNIPDCGELDNFEDLFTFAGTRSELFGQHYIEDPFLTGDAFLIKRKVLESIGFVDPLFYGYFADHDLGIRARRAGFSTVLALGAFAWHQHGSNIEYLAPKERDRKMRDRWARVNENWARFKYKYNLPASQPYLGIRRIPWDDLADSEHGLPAIIPPCDNSRYIIPSEMKSFEWRCYRASVLATQARHYMNMARLDDAEKMCLAALDLHSESTLALTILGTVRTYQRRLDEGMKLFRRALAIDSTCTKAHSNLLQCMNYSEHCSQRTIYRESRRWEQKHSIMSPGKDFPIFSVSHHEQRSRIRIGYVSPDFRQHSVGYFFEPLLQNHDRSQFEVYCYSDCIQADETTERMISLADGWRDISGLDDDEASVMIHKDKLDILVDLAGHTGFKIRLPIFSRRLAPVQVSWLGYPNTTGLSTMDYRITDEQADPLSEGAAFYSEQLCRLPGCFLSYGPPAKAPEVAKLPVIRNGYITFGSFNMLPKITNQVVDVWSHILQCVPKSRLLLKNHFLRDTTTSKRILGQFVRRGIAANRILIFPSDPDTILHLDRYSEVDIALDTFPYNGATTTCEALLMGVPVVTLRGTRHVGRVGGSILFHAGLERFVASSPDEYVALAVALAANVPNLITLRNDLRPILRASSLCDAVKFTRNMEQLLGNLLLQSRRATLC